jgi:hypothetical protein
MKSQQVKSSAGVQCSQQPRVFNNAHEAAASLRGGWKEWKEAGVQFSRFHLPGTDFALPFDPNDYLWAGPVTLKLDLPEDGIGYHRRGHYRRGVRKYLNLLKRGEQLPPVVLLYHEAWDWTMQDGNHRMEALITHRATTYQAYLAKPKKKKPIDQF